MCWWWRYNIRFCIKFKPKNCRIIHSYFSKSGRLNKLLKIHIFAFRLTLMNNRTVQNACKFFHPLKYFTVCFQVDKSICNIVNVQVWRSTISVSSSSTVPQLRTLGTWTGTYINTCTDVHQHNRTHTSARTYLLKYIPTIHANTDINTDANTNTYAYTHTLA